ASVPANAGSQVGGGYGRVRVQRRNFRQLCHRARRGRGDPGGYLRAWLPAHARRGGVRGTAAARRDPQGTGARRGDAGVSGPRYYPQPYEGGTAALAQVQEEIVPALVETFGDGVEPIEPSFDQPQVK